MLPLIVDLNRALAPVDRAADRRAAAIARRLERTAVRQVWNGDEPILDDAREAFAELVLDVMVSAHLAGIGFSTPAYALSKDSVDAALRKAPKHVKNALREIYASVARSIADKPMSKVREALLGQAQAIALGQSKKKADIQAALRKAGIAFDDSPILRTVIRTQGAMAFNAAAWITSQRNPNLWGYEYVTAGDDRVRKTHEEFEPRGIGVRYPADHEFWKKYAPPNGWRCRCSLNPIFFGNSKAKIRAFPGTPDIPPEWQFNPGIFFSLNKAA